MLRQHIEKQGIRRPGDYAKRANAFPVSFIDEILKMAANPEILSFAGGLPDPKFFPGRELAESFHAVLTLDACSSLQYNITEGSLSLRSYLAERFSQRHCCSIDVEQVLITQGAQQALDIVGKAFIDEKDLILTENPTFIGALQAFAPYLPFYLPIPEEEDGIDVDDMKRQLQNYHTVKLFYAMPRFQNPTGCSYSEEKRRRILQLLDGHPLWIVEDDAYGELDFENVRGRPFICDRPAKSLYIGSFSKTVAPALRLGWIIGPAAVINKLAVIKRAADTLGNFTTQMAVHYYLTHYDFDSHVRHVSAAYKARRDRMLAEMSANFPASVRYTRPKGGMFIWVTLPPKWDTLSLSNRLLEKKIAIVPGRPFYPFQECVNSFRMNYSNSSEAEIGAGVKEISMLLQTSGV